MYSLTLECASAEAELVSCELWERGASGVQEEELPGDRVQLRAWFDEPGMLLADFSAFQPLLAREEDIDWAEVSRQAWQPFELGRRLYLAPEWDESPTPRGRLRLTIHPGMALGTGAHPATQLALLALEQALWGGETLLDVGTGSGILAAAAHLLGARPCACDIDGGSVAIAASNLRGDAVRGMLFTGSTGAVRDGAFDVVVANINAASHQVLAADYARIARRQIVLSGFPDRHLDSVVAAVTPRGWSVEKMLEDAEWRCAIFGRA